MKLYNLKMQLTLFGLVGGGGGRGEEEQKGPALSSHVNYFFNIEANATKLSDFFNTLSLHFSVQAI